MIYDQLELELRRLPDVAFVGFLPRDGVVVVQVMLLGSPDATEVKARAEQLCRAHLDTPFTIEIAGSTRAPRIQLVSVGVRRDAGSDELEVQLSFGGIRGVGRGRPGDAADVARATFEALRSLGAAVPFDVEDAARFEHSLGEGVVVILASEESGGRYGVAAGGTMEQAAARATLHALNRYLSAQTLPV